MTEPIWMVQGSPEFYLVKQFLTTKHFLDKVLDRICNKYLLEKKHGADTIRSEGTLRRNSGKFLYKVQKQICKRIYKCVS